MTPKANDHESDKDVGMTVVSIFWYAIFLFWMMSFAGNLVDGPTERIPYSTFMTYAQTGKIDNLVITPREISGKLKEGKAKRFTAVRVEDPQLATRLADQKLKFEGVTDDNFLKSLLSWIMPAVVFFGIWMLLSRFAGKEGPGLSGGLMSIEKNRAKVYVEDKVKVTFQDVAGVDEAKEELREVIGFLKEPNRYSRLGGHLPKGILLVGPPGTGKTLLARAVAGEAGVPFFSISGSEFVELFVGVGAARVRDLFSQAQQSAPCIIFIDELDALGRARGLNPLGGGHDEKEQTLNQLLVEMDGFDSRHGVVLLAATNRPEILDGALLRAGRFDRHVLVDRPDKIGRAQILRVHMRQIVYDESVHIEEVAASTPGFTGADLANLVNEAVLLATRRGVDAVQSQDFSAALERVVAGLEKKNRLLNVHEREVVAFHEMGHALVSMLIPGTDPVQKVSIIPRGIGALGYTMQRPTEDRYLMSRHELEDKLAVLLGGRAAEILSFQDVSTGAADDVAKATEIARSMATRYGMVKTLGPVAYEADYSPFLNGTHQIQQQTPQLSDETARAIDSAVRDLVQQGLERALAILTAQQSKLEQGAQLLLSKETLTQEDLSALLRGDQPAAVLRATKGALLPQKLVNAHSEATR